MNENEQQRRKRGRRPKMLVLRRSCITGSVLWACRAKTLDAARKVFWRVCRREEERVRRWKATVGQRRSNIMYLLNECLAELPIDAMLTDAQQEAVRQLNAIGSASPQAKSALYDHIRESRRRRLADLAIHRQMHQRENLIES